MRVRGQALGLLVAVLAIAGCGDMWGDLFGSKHGAVDPGGGGGTCTKDDSVLTQIILSPPVCSASSPCPCGSYCSSTITGVCVVDCRSDAECALGKTCSSYGQCLGAGSSDAGVPANPSCPRSAPLLLSDDTLKRHCNFDDICPYGSSCNPASGLCSYDCLADSDCQSVDGGSPTAVCSCLGKCVDPATPTEAPSATQPTLVVTPNHFVLPPTSDPPPDQPYWGQQTTRAFTVSMTAAVLIGDGSTSDVTITPGANVQIACPTQTGGGAGTFSSEPCTFNLGNLAQIAGSETYATASKTVTMQPVATVPPGDGGINAVNHWEARVGATGVAGNGQVVTADNSNAFPVAGQSVGKWVPVSAPGASQDVVIPTTFQGTGFIRFTSPTGEQMAIPVAGRGDANWKLVLYDPSKMLSENGKFGLHDNHESFYGDNVPSETNDWMSFSASVHPHSSDGLEFSRITTDQSQDPAHPNQDVTVHVRDSGGGVDGVEAVFDLTLPLGLGLSQQHSLPISVALHLDATPSAGTFCLDGSPCPQGLVCDLGFCSTETTTLPNPAVLSIQPIKQYGYISENMNWDASAQRGSQPGNYSIDNFICGDTRAHGDALLTGAVLNFSGEPACEYYNYDTTSRLPPTAVPLIVHGDLETSGELQPRSAANLLRACMKELARVAPANPNQDFDVYFQNIQATSPDPAYLAFAADCISLGQWRTAVSASNGNRPAQNWLLQQWLQVHAFVGTEGLQENVLREGIGDTDSLPGTQSTNTTPTTPASPLLPTALFGSPPSLDQLVTEMEVGWLEFFTTFTYRDVDNNEPPLHTTDYRISPDLDEAARCLTSADCLSDPVQARCSVDQDCQAGRYCDRSKNFDPAPPLDTADDGTCLPKPVDQAPDYEQPIGLPATILNTMTSHLNLVAHQTQLAINAAYEQNAVLGRQQAVNAAGRALRFALWTEEVAQTVESDLMSTDMSGNPICVTCQNPKWQDRWTAAKSEFKAARATLSGLVATLQSGANPLGLRDDDVPLFFGDVTGTNSRYFASSDYLLNGWAEPSVTAAAGSLAAARDAWIAQQNSQVQEDEAEANRARILDQLKTTYGDKIINNCGPITVANSVLASNQVLDNVSLPPQTGGIDLDSCYIDPKCVGSDDIMNGTIRAKIISDQFTGDVAESQLCKLEFMSQIAPQTCVTITTLPLFGDIKQCVSSIPSLRVQPPANLEANATDFACFLGTQDKPKEACPECNPFTPGTCPKRSDCYYECRRDSGTVNDCTPENMNLCNDANCLFDRSTWATWKDSHGNVPNELQLTPDPDFEAHPWKGAQVRAAPDPADHRPWVYSAKPRSLTRSYCQMPAEYFYQYYPESWTRENLQAEYGTAWAAATAQCSTGDLFTFSASGQQDGPRYPMQDNPLPMPTLDASCFSGAMGQAQLGIQAAGLKLTDTTQQINAKKGTLDDKIEACIKLAKDQQDAQNARNAHKWWKVAIAATAIIGAVAASAVSAGALSGLIFVAAVAAGGLAAAGSQLKANMDESIANLESSLGHSEATRACWEETRDEMRAMADSVTEMQLGYNEIDTQSLGLQRLKQDNHQAALDGKGKVATEEGRKFGSYAHSYWFDEKRDRYVKDFAWAQRLTYLALEAVEYEFQQSLPYKKDILTAQNPSALEDVVIALKQEQAGRTINRRRPEDSSIVLSLRDDVLKVADRSSVTTLGERAWTPAQRFEGQLGDSAFAYFDANGNYTGQAVPFNLGPNGILETRCGERMWRVTATVQGDGLSDSSPNTSLLLLKKNTFSSQWCAGDGDGTTTMQSASIYPSAQLFKPGDPGAADDPSRYTPALMTPWFNIARTEFYKDSYQDGSSEELAGRGLYGDYILLFPKQMLDSGFDITKVEDVLLRIDYLSVDNLSQ